MPKSTFWGNTNIIQAQGYEIGNNNYPVPYNISTLATERENPAYKYLG